MLGIPQVVNKKAEKGTIVHKVMECLAAAKKALQDGRDHFVDDEVMGTVHFKEDMLYKDGFVEFLFEKSYAHYTSRSPHKYEPKEKKEVLAWTYKPLRLLDGAFDPRNRVIVAPEIHFDFEIDAEWAKYDYKLPDGQTVAGTLAMKGTIDLVVEAAPNVYENIDWKTGQRIDWGSNKDWPFNIKTFEKLMHDPQLRIYHYAIHKLFPDVEQVIPTIVFINDHGTKSKPVPGGAFTMPYKKSDIPDTLDIIRKGFEKAVRITRPHLNKSWKCKSFCHFGKTPHPSGEIDPRTGLPHTICSYVAQRTRAVGMSQVLKEEKHESHTFGHYHAPGT